MLIFKTSERMGKQFFWETTAHYNLGGEVGLTQIWYDSGKEVSRNNIVVMVKELKEILTQLEKFDTIE